MEIQAAVLRAPDQPYSIETLELAEPGPGELRIRVVAVGMCHTDILPRVPGFMAPPPIIPGHEGAGIVEAVGPGVFGIVPGTHVLCSFDSCGTCANCLDAHPAYCETFFPRNLTGLRLDGSAGATDTEGRPVAARWFGQSTFATHAVVTARNVVPVDSSLPLELLAPLGCGIQTGAGSVLHAMRVRAGTSIAVFGVGAVGMAGVMAARVAGATTIIAVDLHQHRLDLALELGATHAVDGASSDVAGQILSLTGGLQYAFDTTGAPAVIATAIGCLRPTGVCGLVGVQTGDVVLDPTLLAVGRTVIGILEGDAVPQRFLPQLITLWQQGRMPVDRLVQTFPLSEVNTAEQASLSGRVIKPVLLPGR